VADIRLVAVDLDGTLLTDDLKIEPRAKKALRAVREKGIEVTLATGRMFRSARSYADELELELPLIVYQGAQVRISGTGEILMERNVPLHLARRIIGYIRKFGYAYNVYLDDQLYVESIRGENEEYAWRAGVDLNLVDDMLSFLKEEPLKIVALRNNSSELELLEEAIRRDFNDDLYITRSLPHYLEILNSKVNKALGLKVLAEKQGIKPEEIMVIGDSYNDLQMLQYAGLAVAMGNAPQVVRQAADYVTGTNNEGGVAEALEKFLLS